MPSPAPPLATSPATLGLLRALGVQGELAPSGLFAADHPVFTDPDRPRLIIVDTHEPHADETLRALSPRTSIANGAPITILPISPTTIESIFDAMLAVGKALGIGPHARARVVALRERLFVLGEFVNPFDDGPTLAMIESVSPLRISGLWIAQLAERAGCQHPLNPTVLQEGQGASAGPQQGSRIANPPITLPLSALTALDPEHIVVCIKDTRVESALGLIHTAVQGPEHSSWRNLRALQRGNLAIVGGNESFFDYGEGLVHAYAWLIARTQALPNLFPKELAWTTATIK